MRKTLLVLASLGLFVAVLWASRFDFVIFIPVLIAAILAGQLLRRAWNEDKRI